MTKTTVLLVLLLSTAFNTIRLVALQRQLHGSEVLDASGGRGDLARKSQFRPRHPTSATTPPVSRGALNADDRARSERTSPEGREPKATAPGEEPPLRLIGKPEAGTPEPLKTTDADFASLKTDLAGLAARLDQLQAAVSRMQHNSLLSAMLDGELTVTLPESDERLRFLFVPAGTFTMGYSDGDRQRLVQATGNAFAGHNATPAVTVLVRRGFFILDRELSRGQFAVFERATLAPLPDVPASKATTPTEPAKPAPATGQPSQGPPAAGDGTAAPNAAQPNDQKPAPEQAAADDAKLPVTRISWRKAVDCCDWLKAQTGYDIRLPTEIEWEYAARGPYAQPYPWPEAQAPTDFPAWADKGDTGQPRAVDTATDMDRSWRGVFDLGGNVSEWCLDGYLRDLHTRMQTKAGEGQAYEYDPVTTPLVRFALQRLTSDSDPVRTYRGGSFKDQRWQCEVAGRRSLKEDEASDAVGFRPVLVILPPQDAAQPRKPQSASTTPRAQE